MIEEERWKKISQSFNEHFGKVDESDGKLVFDSGPSSFVIFRSGDIEAEMPLHSLRLESFDTIEFEDGTARVEYEKGTYEFRK